MSAITHGAVVVTGGAGFVGSNVAKRLLEAGRPVVILDNLARPGVEKNVQWLREQHGSGVEVVLGDVRDKALVHRTVARASFVYHFAAQVAVTTSLLDPVLDFEVNAHGTLNVLEAARASAHRPPVVFTSTNKVYGGLEDVALEARDGRYVPSQEEVAAHGISERRPLDFHSPYGCSKGAADQYVTDFARSFGLPTAVFRMSCIYGPRQFGTEDQGWVAHFLIRALKGEPITLYGDGQQVRDILFVGDLCDAFGRVAHDMDRLGGRAYNIGGGASNTVSLLELLRLIEGLTGRKPRTTFEGWRTGDQRYYVSDTRLFGREAGWSPRVGVKEGLRRLHAWLQEAHEVPRAAAAGAPLLEATST